MNAKEAEDICRCAERALRHGTAQLLEGFPGLLKRIISERLWENREVLGEGTVKLSGLHELITSKPLIGWGVVNPHRIESIISHDPEALTLWREAMKHQGKRNDLHHNIMEVDEQKQGTSRAYTLSRLQRERPDLYSRVVAEELSANAAAIEAGWRPKPSNLQRLISLWAKCSPSERQQFLSQLNKVK